MKRLEADVVVIAAGAAGLAAAVAAAEKGAKVTVLEKAATTGGTGNMGMGLLGVESRLQKSKLIGPTKDEAFKIFMDYVHWRSDAQLVRAYIDKSGNTIDWLESMGVKFVDAATYFRGGNQTWHIVKPDNGVPGPMCAGTMYKILTGRAQQLGVKILLKNPAIRILKTNDRITGVIGEDESGEQFDTQTKAVIVATGGIGDSPELIKKNTGYEWGKDMFSMRIPGLSGDGIRMAREVGAAPTDMMMEMIYDMPEFIKHVINPDVTPVFKQPHLLVNMLGKRFLNEEMMINTTFTGNAISAQKDKCSFLIFDNDIMKHMEEEGGLDHLNQVFLVTKVNNIDSALIDAVNHGSKDVFIADTIEGLAEKIGIDPKELRNTVDEYNKFCQKGHDYHFDKNYRYLRPVKTPKFYAGRLCCSAYGSLGGIKINYKTEVLDKNWKRIPGLYAAGVDACSIYGDSYPFILPGNTMGFSVNTGRIAGENAADYVKSVNK